MTKIWKPSYFEEEYTEASIVNMNDYVNSYLGRKPGDLLADIFSETTTLLIETKHPPDDHFRSGTKFFVSDRLKEVLVEFEVLAEFLPFHVIYNGLEYTDRKFYFCNILDIVECLDLKRGEYTFHHKAGFTDHVDKIKKLAIDEEKVAPYHLFRIAKGAEYIVCVSDALANAIEQNDLTGSVFVKPEDWTFC